MLRENDTTAMTREEQLDYIDESLAMSLELLNDTLEFCQGTVKLEPIPGDCQALLSKHLRMIELRLETARVPVQIDIPPGLSAVFDPARLGRVIYNLAKNAGEAVHGHPGGLVKITASRSSTGITFTVSDNGAGLPEEVQASCFSRSAPLGNGAAPALDLPSQNNWSTHTGAVSTPRRAQRHRIRDSHTRRWQGRRYAAKWIGSLSTARPPNMAETVRAETVARGTICAMEWAMWATSPSW